MELTDIHCHILPGVDDGADTMEEARKMLRLEYEDGVRTIIATPHYREGMFEPVMRQVVKAYTQVREMARGMGMRLYLGCEYHTNSRMVKDLRRKRRPTMVGSSYVLTEFSGAHNYEKIRNQVYDLLTEGYQPILAHIERYPCLREDIQKVRELVDLGAYIQMNAGAILGESGSPIRKFGRQVMEEDLLHFIASDAHGVKYRRPNLGACAKYVSKKMGQPYAEKIFCGNPDYILREARRQAGLRARKREKAKEQTI